ncbi:MAG: ATP-binding protein [Nitrospirae bacterium]|nr:ATP-binding protein [Nitrospirota bacterium]
MGRQQIAGIPTAISELFKNAHDAYADNVEVDYIRKKKLFILRDDGLGMTADDFEKRWLVLGTESKYDNRSMSPPPLDPSKPIRPIMGEKGIGRLAISAIGRQVLILSRAKRDDELKELVAVLINWGIFEIPGLDLDDVSFPLRQFPIGILPNIDDIESMKNELIDSIGLLKGKGLLTPNETDGIVNDISEFTIDLNKSDATLPGNLSIKNNSGTHFYISPVAETLNLDIDRNPTEKDKASKIEKLLIGFTDTMTPGVDDPYINVEFREFKSDDGSYDDVLDKESFFTKKDFQQADHRFSGAFDEYGNFSGKISIYNEYTIDHTIPWTGNNSKETACGPFTVDICVLQGALKDSIVDPITYSAIRTKTDRFGGLYIYKDGIRILPYGDTDYDFVDMEKNRTKSASYYFFSFRRIFGSIHISKKANPNLIEKAGREGFIENKAYRQVREILMNFFLQLAADFFRENSPGVYTEYWANKKAERGRFYKAKEQREKKAKGRKQKFLQDLNDFFHKTQTGVYDKIIDDLLIQTERQFASVSSIEDTDDAVQAMIDYETSARKEINRIRNETKIPAPRGFSISKDDRIDWEAYLDRQASLDGQIFSKAEKRLGDLVDKHRTELNLDISKKKRIESALDVISKEAKTLTGRKRTEAREISEKLSRNVRQVTQELMENLEKKIREVQVGISALKTENSSDSDIYEQLKQFELPIIQEKDYANTILENIIEQLVSIYWEKDDTGKIVTNKQIEASMEEEIGDLKEKLVSENKLIQLGLAVNIVHHEFSSAVKSLRIALRDLKRWAEIDEKLINQYISKWTYL